MSWIASNLMVSAGLIAIVLVIRRPVARRFGAHAAYALWLAPLLRLALPPIGWASAPAASADPSGAILWMKVTTSAVTSPSLWPWLVAVWLVGAATMLGYHLVTHDLFLRRALREGRPIEREGVDCDLIITPAVAGPLATGLIHRLVLIPEDFGERFDAEEQRLALAHECLHHRRGDLWASAAALLVASLQWFNPLAHVALGAFRRDMEAACDATLIARLGSDQAALYARTILRSAAAPVPRSLCALTSIDELKGRLTMLKLSHGTARRITGLTIAGGLVAAGLALSAPAAADEPQKTTVMEKKIIIHGADGDHVGSNRDFEKVEMDRKCPGEKVDINAEGGTADKKAVTRIVICGEKGESAASLADALDKAMARIDQDSSGLDPAVKADLKAKLEAKIKELRSRG